MTAACAQTETVRVATLAMGTRFEFVLCGGSADALRSAGEEAIEAVEDAHRRLTRFEPGGPVFEINRRAGEAGVLVDDEVLGLLDRCDSVRAASGGAFSVVRTKGAAAERAIAPPLSIDGRGVGLAAASAFLDLGGVAKGFGLDLAAEVLRDAGVASALLHGGSSTIVAIGAPPDADAWRIALTDAPGGSPFAIAELRDAALTVSSQAGDRPGHVIDPATGESATGAGWAACLGESAEATDAWATALLVLGERPRGMPVDLTSVLLCPDRRPVVAGPLSGSVARTDRANDGSDCLAR